MFTGCKAFPLSSPAPVFSPARKTNTVSSCVHTTMKPPEWLPFTEIINCPSMKNRLQSCMFLWVCFYSYEVQVTNPVVAPHFGQRRVCFVVFLFCFFTIMCKILFYFNPPKHLWNETPLLTDLFAFFSHARQFFNVFKI